MSYLKILENPKQIDLINSSFDINLQKNGFSTKIIKKNNIKSIKFYNIEETDEINSKDIDIILSFFYSIKINENVELPFNIFEEKIFKNCNFSWKNIFNFLSLYISIDSIYDLLKDKVTYVKKDKDIIKKIYKLFNTKKSRI